MMPTRGQSRDGPQPRSLDSSDDGTSPVVKTKSTQRAPPPSLFLHPSPGASHVSLPGILGSGASVSTSSAVKREQSNLDNHSQRFGSASIPPERSGSIKATHTSNGIRSGADRTDALWAEMQATLEEVELSASGGTHVFGPDHDGKLAELRTAQIALAQAWARSEADDAIETTFLKDSASTSGEIKGALSDETRTGLPDGKDSTKNAAAAAPMRAGTNSIDGEGLGAKLVEETEDDIRLARKRREANDEYFERVNKGVIDVVAKLEAVAVAMRAVEQESRDVWPDNESQAANR